VVVQAHALPVVIEARAQLLEQLTQLTAAHEAGQPAPWQLSDAPADFIEQMSRQIVGIEMPMARIFGKCKVSQHRALPDRQAVVAGLQRRLIRNPWRWRRW
jgi:transcriptional regulator